MEAEKSPVIDQTKVWIEQFILKYNICPFARTTVESDLISFRECRHITIEQGLMAMVDYFRYILSTPSDQLSNAFMVFTGYASDFHLFLDLFDYSGILLEDMKLVNHLQIVPFHPLFQFEGESFEDASNYTNRSPYPMIHILRVEEVAAAINSHPDIDKVPLTNKALLRSMSDTDLESIKMLLRRTI